MEHILVEPLKRGELWQLIIDLTVELYRLKGNSVIPVVSQPRSKKDCYLEIRLLNEKIKRAKYGLNDEVNRIKFTRYSATSSLSIHRY